MCRGHLTTCSTAAGRWRRGMGPGVSLRSWGSHLAARLERPVDSLRWRPPVGTRVSEEVLCSVDSLVAGLGILISGALRSGIPGAMS
jgi:hypothetical protein